MNEEQLYMSKETRFCPTCKEELNINGDYWECDECGHQEDNAGNVKRYGICYDWSFTDVMREYDIPNDVKEVLGWVELYASNRVWQKTGIWEE